MGPFGKFVSLSDGRQAGKHWLCEQSVWSAGDRPNRKRWNPLHFQNELAFQMNHAWKEDAWDSLQVSSSSLQNIRENRDSGRRSSKSAYQKVFQNSWKENFRMNFKLWQPIASQSFLSLENPKDELAVRQWRIKRAETLSWTILQPLDTSLRSPPEQRTVLNQDAWWV